jgi:GDP/UDP-N,N'-diacetylbacillosamine 2-epimerase (hydrolysing)
MHLSPGFGLTYKEVEKDFKIDKKIEMLLSSDTSIGISKDKYCVPRTLPRTLPELLGVSKDKYCVPRTPIKG